MHLKKKNQKQTAKTTCQSAGSSHIAVVFCGKNKLLAFRSEHLNKETILSFNVFICVCRI